MCEHRVKLQTDGFQQRSLSIRRPHLEFSKNCCSGRYVGWVGIHLPWFTQNINLKKTAVGSLYNVWAFPEASTLCRRAETKPQGWTEALENLVLLSTSTWRNVKEGCAKSTLYQGQWHSMLTVAWTVGVQKENRPAHTTCFGVLSYLHDVRICWWMHTNTQTPRHPHILPHLYTHTHSHPGSFQYLCRLSWWRKNKKRVKGTSTCVHAFIYTIFIKQTLGRARYCPKVIDR